MAAAVETLYRVSAGDSLSKIAQKFYGDANRYTDIARLNNLNPTAVLYIGQPLRLPSVSTDELQEVQITAQRLPTTAPASPGGSVVDPVTSIETVTTTAYVWWKDWRWYAAIGGVGLALWYFSGKRR